MPSNNVTRRDIPAFRVPRVVTEDIIRRVETAIGAGVCTEEIHQMLIRDERLSEHNAWLAYKAAEISLKMFERETVSFRQRP